MHSGFRRLQFTTVVVTLLKQDVQQYLPFWVNINKNYMPLTTMTTSLPTQGMVD